MPFLIRVALIQNPQPSVIAPGLHGIVEKIGLFEGPHKEGGRQTSEGLAGGLKVYIAEPGVLGSAKRIRNVKEHKDKPVDQKHELNQEIRAVYSLKDAQNICDGGGQR